jgi:hypothetical protein
MKILNKIFKIKKEKPRNLWKDVDFDQYQVKIIYFIIYYK